MEVKTSHQREAPRKAWANQGLGDSEGLGIPGTQDSSPSLEHLGVTVTDN